MKHSDNVPGESMEILNGLPQGAALLDADGRLVAMNGRLEALTGHASEDARGVPGEHVVRCLSSHEGSLAAEALRRGAPVSVESDLLSADRRRVPVRITASPLRGTGGAAALLLVEEVAPAPRPDAPEHGPGPVPGFLAGSPQMQAVFRLLPIVARTDATLLVTGETGTGKDLFAEAVHGASPRAKFPFVKVNCGALPETLLESELFGHARGAFTGAHADKPGMFRLAQGGTLFLTEIGDLPLPLQVKLLTALDDRAFYPLGGTRKVEVDVRVVAGTHRNLEELVARGQFRQDLFFRLNVLAVHLPPLRERDGDVRLLADHFVELFSKRLGKPVQGISPLALSILKRYPYPGNVRELRNVVEYAVSVCREGQILPDHLPEYVVRGVGPAAAQPRAGARPDAGARPPRRRALSGKETWSDVERSMILDTLLECRGNRGEAAKRLGWGRSTLWRKMKQHGMDGR